MRFYFDFISPYAYLAWTQLRTRPDLTPVPILFAGLLEAHGTRGPAEVPAKRRYIFRDTLRTARRLGVPFAPPPAHPFNPLLALRVASLPTTPRSVIDALFSAVWGGGHGVTDPAEVARIAGESAITEANTPENKQRLRQQTDDAIARGVFGVPTIEVDGELFWGVDSIANLDAYLRGDGAIDPADIARWESLPAQATRRGQG